GEVASIVVALVNPGPRSLEVQLREALHPSLARAPLHETLSLAPGTSDEWTYSLRPRRRGRMSWGPLTARLLGPLGLAWTQRDLIDAADARVYPRVRWGGRVGKLLALAQRHQLGQSPTRAVGEGAEPYALRTYRRGDPPRKIHWRASARHGRLISREETWEQGARLVLLLDCGRSMASTDDDRSKLDHSLAAALALLRLANGRGDRVTVVAYSDRIERRIRVRPGVAGIRSAYQELFDLRARRVESDHILAVEAAVTLEPRRSVAVFCTSVTDLATSERLIDAIERLRRRHQTLLVNLEDPRVAARAASRPVLIEEAFAKISAMEIQLANRDLGRRLSGRGVTTVTTAADRLALETLDAYLGVMERSSRSRSAGRLLRSASS
ncbi:MAG: DUF58 domain-containing protein, partial [Thermoanaerobaculia bacterium]|nr:DUF58 domain-containing protein [Thermoanaerobaculia bacterium]